MHETATGPKKADAGTLRALMRHPAALLVVMSLTASGAICIYAFTTYMQKYLVNTAGMDVKTASSVMTGSLIVFICLQPIIGALSDRIGRRTCLLIFTGVMTVAAVPLLNALSVVQSAGMAFVLVATAVTILSFYTSVSGLFKAELFPAHVRALGVNIAHSISAAVFGGTVEYVALLFKQEGHENYFYWYVAAMCALTFIVAIKMKETRTADMRV
jgi:MHS family alpha-ketoglutarate permease-like MFS transporter